MLIKLFSILENSIACVGGMTTPGSLLLRPGDDLLLLNRLLPLICCLDRADAVGLFARRGVRTPSLPWAKPKGAVGAAPWHVGKLTPRSLRKP